MRKVKQQIHERWPTLKAAIRAECREGDLKAQLKILDREFGYSASPDNPRRHADSLVISDATHDLRLNDMSEGIDAMRLKGLAPGYLDGLKVKHFLVAVEVLIELKLKVTTVRRKISALRTLYGWMEKADALPANAAILPQDMQHVPTCATADPTWSGNGLDPQALIASVPERHQWIRDALALMWRFGLRLSEALMLDVHASDRGLFLIVDHKSKGQRARFVPVELEVQRALLDELKSRYPAGRALVGTEYESTQEEARSRYYNIVHHALALTRGELGVVTHGLRAEYLCELYVRITGVKPPIQGGPPIPRDVDRMARRILAYAAGHGRVKVSTRYVGPVLRGFCRGVGTFVDPPELSGSLAFVLRHQEDLFEVYAPRLKAMKAERLERRARLPKRPPKVKQSRTARSRLSALKQRQQSEGHREVEV